MTDRPPVRSRIHIELDADQLHDPRLQDAVQQIIAVVGEQDAAPPPIERVHYVHEDGLTACSESDDGDGERWTDDPIRATCPDCIERVAESDPPPLPVAGEQPPKQPQTRATDEAVRSSEQRAPR